MELEKGRSAGNSANDKTSAREKLLKGWTDSWATNMQTPVGLFEFGIASPWKSWPGRSQRRSSRPFHRLEDSRDRDRLSRYLALLHEGE